jgi:ABC-type branched-subunit amino acid transport system substrate-binding protein
VKRTRALALGMALAVVLAACGRSDEEVADSSAPGATDATTAPGGTTDTTAPASVGLDEGGFGDLGTICSAAPEGTDLAASDTGVTADSIQISTFSDPGFPGRPGLNQEMFDTAEAFTNWCNEHGGINGRKIDLELRDAMLTQFQQRVIEACDEGDFAMVGGGAVFDDTGQVERLACELPNIAGYVVTAAAAESDLTVGPVPNPPNSLPIGDFKYLEEQFPGSTQNVAVLTGDLNTTIVVAERYKEGIEKLGWKVVYDDQYPAAGVESWRPYAEGMKSKNVTGLIWVGEPVNLGKLMSEAKALGVELQWARTDANHYDPKLLEVGDDADGVYVRSVFAPFLGDAVEPGSASEEYNQLIDQYDEGGIKAYLGVQALSSWLLFATAARDCGAELTRDCLLEKASGTTSWNGGGLHAPMDLSGIRGPDCFDLLVVEGGEFTLTDIEPNNGIFLCDAANLIELSGDYGEGTKCKNPDFATDPTPSNCGDV